MSVKPGAYRELFTKALLVFMAQPQTSEDEKSACQYYIDILKNKEYVFGKPEAITMLKRNSKDH